MAETTRTRKTRVEETTTIEIDGEALAAILTAHFGLDDRAKVDVTVFDGGYENIEVGADARVTITQTIVSRDDTETGAITDPNPTTGFGVRPPGTPRRMPRREPLPTSGDEDLGQDKG